MKLVIDIGNTNIKFGLFDKQQIKELKIIPTKTYKATPSFSKFSKCVIGSVVPSLNKKISNDIYKKFNIKSKIITLQDFKNDFDFNHFKNPSEIGLDILAFATAIKYETNKAVGISFGTATFAIAINRKDIYGVAITPSFYDSLKQLKINTSLIKNTNLGNISFNLGNDTKSSLSSGITHAINGFINSIMQYCQQQYGIDRVYIDGGKSELVKLNQQIKRLDSAVLKGYNLITN